MTNWIYSDKEPEGLVLLEHFQAFLFFSSFFYLSLYK